MVADNPAIVLGGVPVEVHECTGLLPDLLSAKFYSLPILFCTSGAYFLKYLAEPTSFLNAVTSPKYHVFTSDIKCTHLTYIVREGNMDCM